MIDTLTTLTEQIHRRLSGGDVPDDSPWDTDFLMQDLRNAIREDLKLEYLQSKNEGDEDKSTLSNFIASYFDIEVKVERQTRKTYIDLPQTPMTLRYNKGIWNIYDMKNPEKAFIYVANPDVTRNLPGGDLERNNFGFYREGLKAYFTRDIKREKVDKCLLKMVVVAPESMGVNDPLPLLPENTSRIIDIVVKRNVTPMLPNDRLNDGNPNIRPTNV